ncbi:MAG: hypothetical protein KJO46_08395 [Gammaproteobacteria bacterium]|nr:hypothetical protein [Gammaproteobacteria bacterium]
MDTTPDSGVLTVADIPLDESTALLHRFGLTLQLVENDAPIPGSYWGKPEAGIIGSTVYVRCDTPMHSLLHECCHVICMTCERRRRLQRDAGGDDLEESAVCYLQILLADLLPGVGRQRLMRDMDVWGYSFRLGSTRQWFEQDADDAHEFLLNHALISQSDTPTFRLRK